MPRLLNRNKHGVPPGAVYIGRGTPWGNEYISGVHGTKSEVIHQYIQEKRSDPEFVLSVKRELKGKDLVCSCAPSQCHGDWLILIANED